MNTMTEQHLLTAPADQIKQYGVNAQRLGQASTTNIEQSGVPAGNVTREAGKYIPEGIQPNTPYTNRTAAATGGPPATPAAMQADAAANGVAGAVGRTPAQAIADRTPPANVFQPRVVKNSDGTISSSVTPETTGMQGAAVDRFKQMQETASRAQSMHSQLDAIEHDNDVLNSAGWSSTGAGANAKLGAAKSINSFFTTMGIKAPIDEAKVGSWEGYNKQTFRAGADFARTLGGHAAESVVQGSVNATPNAENTYFGSKVIVSSMRQAIQRETDLYNFALDKAKTTGSSFGAEAEFNKQFPPKLYSQTAIANAVPQTSIDRLKSTGDDKNKSMFDATYGKGMADFVLKAH